MYYEESSLLINEGQLSEPQAAALDLFLAGLTSVQASGGFTGDLAAKASGISMDRIHQVLALLADSGLLRPGERLLCPNDVPRLAATGPATASATIHADGRAARRAASTFQG